MSRFSYYEGQVESKLICPTCLNPPRVAAYLRGMLKGHPWHARANDVVSCERPLKIGCLHLACLATSPFGVERFRDLSYEPDNDIHTPRFGFLSANGGGFETRFRLRLSLNILAESSRQPRPVKAPPNCGVADIANWFC